MPLAMILAAIAGLHPSRYVLILLAALPLVVLLAHKLSWGLVILPAAALLVPLRIGTGTDVSLSPPVVVVPLLAGLWILAMVGRRSIRLAPSRLNRPLLAFLAVALLSLLRGTAFWDPLVPRAANLPLVQVGQVAIYVVSFLAFWLMANLATDLRSLRRTAYSVLALLGASAIWMVVSRLAPLLPSPPQSRVLANLSSLWMAGLALALALHDRELSSRQRILLYLLAVTACMGAFLVYREWMGGWVPTILTAGLVLWLGAPRLRVPVVVIGLALVLAFGIDPLVRGLNLDQEFAVSGGGRLLLWRTTIDLGRQSPLLGLGPAAYRHYGWMQPLVAATTTYQQANISAHNQFIDLFAQIGLLGLACYLWFLVEAALLAHRLWRRSAGFARGYALAGLCALAGSVLADMLAETSLPFVYNMGFDGLRASVVSWMLLGGLPVLENAQRAPKHAGVGIKRP